MRRIQAVIVLVLALGGLAVAQTPGFQPKGEEQLKAATLHQQAVIEIRNMQVAQLQFEAAERRLADIRTAQRQYEPVLLKSVGAKPGSGWDWDRMALREPPPDKSTEQPGKPK